jgi:hypothetical protein
MILEWKILNLHEDDRTTFLNDILSKDALIEGIGFMDLSPRFCFLLSNTCMTDGIAAFSNNIYVFRSLI